MIRGAAGLAAPEHEPRGIGEFDLDVFDKLVALDDFVAKTMQEDYAGASAKLLTWDVEGTEIPGQVTPRLHMVRKTRSRVTDLKPDESDASAATQSLLGGAATAVLPRLVAELPS